ncbi:hypothetical protein RF11_15962 [Thelohanellus kitauei]|uniref:Uncharacterized protein n=1 Tax=Thelohanellus kitauei TaxID=669202 RepID=A0A0C2JBC9_THEKT|nr:hypothetical protein RF11_15962 [Thelohanellus kitauei]
MVDLKSFQKNKQLQINEYFDNYLCVIRIKKCITAANNCGSILISLLIEGIFVRMNVDSETAVFCVGKHLLKKMGSPMLKNCQTLGGLHWIHLFNIRNNHCINGASQK